jgi:hypothetical protein
MDVSKMHAIGCTKQLEQGIQKNIPLVLEIKPT